MNPVILILMLMLMGMGVAHDEASMRHAAVRKLALRASGGDPKALYDLASLHDRGYDTIPVDSVRSTMLYRLSAEKGYPLAQSYLGYRYFKGEIVRQDVDSALYWFAKAAGSGDARAANNLGYLLANSDVVARDYPQAFHWLSKAASSGLPAAESQLADLYRQGLGTEKDTLQASALYMKAIEGGLADAELKLLSMLGRKWETLPADSAVNLGRYYYTHRAPLIGVSLFKNASRHGNAEALALLGDAYSRGVGVEYDHEQSTVYFLSSALRGNPSSQFVIAELLEIFPDGLSSAKVDEVLRDYYSGREVPDEIYTARYWYDKAAEKGVKDAETATRVLIAN